MKNYLNSNIEIHKFYTLRQVEKWRVYLNSNIEIHKLEYVNGDSQQFNIFKF